jgi:nitrous oxide reductase accessory protein NosL
MKQNRDAAALAASLQAAASTPLPLPAHNQERERATASAAPLRSEPAPRAHAPLRKKTRKARATPDTVGITLRPERELHNRYVLAAAERTRKEGKVISAQQIMLEVLATGPKVK